MTDKEALDWLISRKEHYEMDDDCQELAEAIQIGINAIKQKPCEDAVSKQAVAEVLLKYAHDPVGKRFAEFLVSQINDLPPVTPEPKIGHWIVDGSIDCYLDKVRCHCSECGKKKVFPADYDHIKQELSISYKYPEFIDNFCPNCGAKMLEVKNEVN